MDMMVIYIKQGIKLKKNKKIIIIQYNNYNIYIYIHI